LAIVDDIVVVLIIAYFYSSGLDHAGLAVCAVGITMVLIMQRLGIGAAPAYVLAGANRTRVFSNCKMQQHRT
jgi:NhaA family Na+:H+ antiporter